jgi:hypothetical protein
VCCVLFITYYKCQKRKTNLFIENKSWTHHDPELEQLSDDEYHWRQLWCSVNDAHHVLHPSEDYTWPPCALMVMLHEKTKQFPVAVKLKVSGCQGLRYITYLSPSRQMLG